MVHAEKVDRPGEKDPRGPGGLGFIAARTGRATAGREPSDIEPRGVHLPPVISDGVSERNGKVSQ